MDPTLTRRLTLAVVGVVLASCVGWLAWNTVSANRAWQDVERVEFDPEAVRGSLESRPPASTSASNQPAGDTEQPPVGEVEIPDDEVRAFLVVGTDRKIEDEEGHSDAVHVVLLPTDSRMVVLTSVPRDLVLPNPCTGEAIEVKNAMSACEQAPGPTSLAIVVEAYLGTPIDHFVQLDFAGFATIIDRVGGVEICLANPMRDRTTGTGFELPSGCTQAGGQQALGWVTSRTTEEQVDGQWEAVEDVNARTRDRRQLDLLLKLLGRVDSFDSISEFGAVVADLSSTVVLDEAFSLQNAIELAWDLRSVEAGQLAKVHIPTEAESTEDGLQLRPLSPFGTLLVEAWPDVAQYSVAP